MSRQTFHPRDWQKGKCAPESPNSSEKVGGFVAFYDARKRFGFIATVPCEAFFHITDVSPLDRGRIAEGIRIVCHVEPSELKGKMRARHVAIVEQV